jgi:hypothetical protein
MDGPSPQQANAKLSSLVSQGRIATDNQAAAKIQNQPMIENVCRRDSFRRCLANLVLSAATAGAARNAHLRIVEVQGCCVN